MLSLSLYGERKVRRREGGREGGRFVYDVFDLNVSVFFSQLLKVLPAL